MYTQAPTVSPVHSHATIHMENRIELEIFLGLNFSKCWRRPHAHLLKGLGFHFVELVKSVTSFSQLYRLLGRKQGLAEVSFLE